MLTAQPRGSTCPRARSATVRGRGRPAQVGPAADLAAAVRRDLALHAEPRAAGSPRNPVDLAYVSMLKHDAYVASARAGGGGSRWCCGPRGRGRPATWPGNRGAGSAARSAQRCQQADAVVSISAGDHRRAARRRLRPGAGSTRCPTACPCPSRPGSAAPAGATRPRAVFVGRLAPEKGLDALVDAWPEVVAALPEGPADARSARAPSGQRWKRRSRGSAWAGLGRAARRDRSTRPAALRAADLFVLPSREEGMSIALLEAMALGIPLVASSIPGNRRLVSDFKHGRLVPPDDPAALARAVIDQWSGFDRAFHMSRAARRRVAGRVLDQRRRAEASGAVPDAGGARRSEDRGQRAKATKGQRAKGQRARGQRARGQRAKGRFHMTESRRRTTGRRQRPAIFWNLQSALCNPRSALCNPQSTLCNPQSTLCNLQSAIRNLQSAIRDLPRLSCLRALCSAALLPFVLWPFAPLSFCPLPLCPFALCPPAAALILGCLPRPRAPDRNRRRAERAATDPDPRPLGGREADGLAGQGIAARPVPGRGGRLDAARAAGGASSARRGCRSP